MVVFDASLLDTFSEYKRKNLAEIFSMVEDRKNLIDLLEKMLAYLPSKRISAEEAMKHPFFKEQRLEDEERKAKLYELEESYESTAMPTGSF